MRDERAGRWRQLFRLGPSPIQAPEPAPIAAPPLVAPPLAAWDVLRGPTPIPAAAALFPEPAAQPPATEPAATEPAAAEPATVVPEVEPAEAFDEWWYVRENQDVALAIAEGRCASGLAHYLAHGRDEGRRPRPDLPIAAPAPAPVRLQAAAPATATAGWAEPPLAALAAQHGGTHYLAPHDLRVADCPIRRVMVIGSCFVDALGLAREGGEWQADFHLTNNMSRLPDAPPHEPAEYDFQIVQVALRSVLPDAAFWQLPHADPQPFAALFESVRARLALQLQSLLAWNRSFGIPALVMNFLVPQANPMGRLLPRYDLRNPVHFIEQLNAELERSLAGWRDVHLLDVDAVAASLGRRYVQDDAVGHLSHNSVLPNFGTVQDRIEPLLPMSHYYDTAWSAAFAAAVRGEIVAMHRTLRQADAVKLVVVDLDDTLWRGVSGELAAVGGEMIEGWPLGLAEALAYLRRRGILLAILSRNDDARIAEQWEQIFRGRLRLSDFATRRIDWNPKQENMQAILAELNLLPGHVVFIDDNPAERAAMQQAFPAMRVLGRHPYYLRRILLWSPETQVAGITDESARRTEMVRAQIERGQLQQAQLQQEVSREAFLQSLGVTVQLYRLGIEHAKFARALELLNRTNQFNTTGRRWRSDELAVALAASSALFAFEVADRLTGYGLVGVVVVAGAAPRIEQFVMSCRVVGLDVEVAVLAALVRHLRQASAAPLTAAFTETDSNLLCRELFAAAGFVRAADGWALPAGVAPAMPDHVAVDATAL